MASKHRMFEELKARAEQPPYYDAESDKSDSDEEDEGEHGATNGYSEAMQLDEDGAGTPEKKKKIIKHSYEAAPQLESESGYIAKVKQKVLILATRGIISRYRHLMNDFRALLPHMKKESKLDSKDSFYSINELAELHGCNNCVLFESRKRQDLYLWFAKTPNGPSIKFHVANVHTMLELKMTGNCLKYSRPLLAFDKNFDEQPHFRLMKEMFTQVCTMNPGNRERAAHLLPKIFSTPRGHPKSKPFIDHVFSFCIQDDRVWFRNYQITEKEPGKRDSETILVEIGPRFVLNPIAIFTGSFCGAKMWENEFFVSPNQLRSFAAKKKESKYVDRLQSKQVTEQRKREVQYEEDETMDIFK